MRKIFSLILLACTLIISAAPASSYAQSAASIVASILPSVQIPDCSNASGGLPPSVGRTAAMGGTFVPVSDAAVTLDVGTLVYKDCVLKAIIDRAREYQTALLVQGSLNNFLNGGQVCDVDDDGAWICQSGGPMFPENLAVDQGRLADNVVKSDVNGTLLNMVPTLYQDDVKRTITRTYAQQTRNPGGSLACSYQGTPAGLAAIHRGGYSGPQDLFTIADPNCNPLFSFFNAQSLVMSDVAAQQQDMLTRLGWNNGVYDITNVDAMGVSRVVTPGFIVANELEQKLGSSFRQLENANDIGYMVNQYFAGIGQQILSAGVNGVRGGLQGLITAQFGQKSYLGTAINQIGAGLQSSIMSDATQKLTAAVANEQSYLNAKNNTVAVINNAIAQMRGAESQCWNLIIPKATAYAQQNNISSLKIATTTTASQAFINSNITALANRIQGERDASSANLTKVNQIATVINSTNPTDAISQLTALVASGVLHSFEQAQAAIKETQDVQSALTAVVTDTITAWGDNQDPNIGWCNINNPAVISGWANRWRI